MEIGLFRHGSLTNSTVPMVLELRSRANLFNSHIILFLLLLLLPGAGFSQSVLLPGDIAVVSVNSSDNSYDFMPLVNVEQGTSLWFSNGKWIEEDKYLDGGDEVNITFNEDVAAGTNIHINEIVDPRLTIDGKLRFSGNGDHLFAYQKEEDIYRFLFGIGWGDKEVWNPDHKRGSEIPLSLQGNQEQYLTLGEFDNYQYHLRNGASGTPAMLSLFVTDAAHWRGKNKEAFSSFGTSFRILRAPVVMFDESVSTVQEGESIILNVAVYEHDGSRLTVDVVFNPDYSTADTSDIKFKGHTFNFTGLIGNAVYAIEVPVNDDKEYEGSETAFFELRSISKGVYGDFVSHAEFIQDNELPNARISGLSYSGRNSDFIEIQNGERNELNLEGWTLESRNVIYKFTASDYIPALSTLKIYHPDTRKNDTINRRWLQRSGTLILKDESGNKLSELSYRRGDNSGSMSIGGSTGITAVDASIMDNNGGATRAENGIREAKVIEPGWYTLTPQEVLSEEMQGLTVYGWNEAEQKFELADVFDPSELLNKNFIAFVDEDITQVYQSLRDSLSKKKSAGASELRFVISGTDIDENNIINGAEGYNFVQNNTGEPIPVRTLIDAVEKELNEGAVYPYVYTWQEDGKNWTTSRKLDRKESIAAGASFWVRADSVFEETEISLSLAEPLEITDLDEEVKDYSDQTQFTIRLGANGLYGRTSINIFEEELSLERDQVLPQLEPELFVPHDRYLYLGGERLQSWNDHLYFEKIDDQKIIIPLAFSTSEEGTFHLSVDEWKNIPSDWRIKIVDLESEKEYELGQGWNMEFDYFGDIKPEVKEGTIESEGVTIIENRFQVHIIPPGAMEQETEEPTEVALNQNYPNPFNPVTTLSFYLPESQEVKLSVFNVVGQPVAVLAEGTMSAGDHTFEWDATGLPSGMYIYQLEVANRIMTRKMTLVK